MSEYPIIEELTYPNGTSGFWVIVDENDEGSAYTSVGLDTLLDMLEGE